MNMTCKGCGTPIREPDAFCTKCGMRSNAPARPVTAGHFCTKCGAPLAETKFCTRCGASAEPFAVTANAVGSSFGVSEKPSSVTGDVHFDGPSPAGEVTPRTTRLSLNPGTKLPKILIVAVVSILVFATAITAGVVYIAHRARQKAAELEADSNVQRNLAALKTAANAGGAKSSKPSSGGSESSSNSAARGSAKPDAPYGWMLENGKLVPAPAPPSPFVAIVSTAPSTPIAPASATGDPLRDWALQYERTEGGPEADLVVRTGDVNNLGFGWPQGFDPFSGESTPVHPYPRNPPPGTPDGTDRILIGSSLLPPADYPVHSLSLRDGYSGVLGRCVGLGVPPPGQICRQRQESMPQAIRLAVGTLPSKINSVVFQIFVDDFQAVDFGSHFQVSLNGTRIPSFEYAINSLDQTGPIGKLVSLKLLQEYWPLLNSGEVKFLIDDPTTKQGDGYAVDFVRILVNPHKFKYQVSLSAAVVDADKRTPISGATVTAGLESASTDKNGKCQLSGLPAGLVIATGTAAGYDENSVPVDLPAGHAGTIEIQLHTHQESTTAMEKSIEQTGSATIYGIHFDSDSAKLKPDSTPALEAVLGLINNHLGSRWIIAGHTDNQGNSAHNQVLSQNRAASVIAWLKAHGVDSSRLAPQGFGAIQPVADNATANGRALNRRVEIAPARN